MMRYTNNNLKAYLQPAFLICAAVLAIAGAGVSIAVNYRRLYLAKDPIALSKSLDVLDENGLGNYKVEPQNKLKIENPEVVEALGTEDYIQWVVEDSSAEAASPAARCVLFITYYGHPDKVPHVPEECYVGSGYERLESESVTLKINNHEGFKKNITARYLVFGSPQTGPWQESEKFGVLYLFRVNDEYTSGREQTRRALNKSIFRRHSYFSKVEMAFNQGTTALSREQIVEAGEKLLSVILPILENEHWPVLED